MAKNLSENKIRVGCSGWSYPDWKRAGFYPKGSKPGEYLKHYAEHFNTVEVDGSYYRTPSKDDCKRWADLTPDGFLFSLKFPKQIVHGGGPRDRDLVDENIWSYENVFGVAERFIEATAELGEKRGPILVQCPRYPKRIFGGWEDFIDRVFAFLRGFEDVRFAIEVRNGDWICPKFVDELHGLRYGMVLADFRDVDGSEREALPQARQYLDEPWRFAASGVAYLRLIGNRWSIEKVTKKWDAVVLDRSGQIAQWATAINDIAKRTNVPVVAYTNNHFAGHGPETARELIAALDELS